MNFIFEPSPTRDLRKRQEVASKLRHWIDTNWPKGVAHLEKGVDGNPPIAVVANDVLQQLLNANSETLDTSTLQVLGVLADVLSNTSESQLPPVSVSDIEFLIAIESEPHPASYTKKFASLLPQFVIFTQEDRDLSSTYELAQFYSGQSPQRVPRALVNLAQAAELPLHDLFLAMQQNDQGRVETIIDHSNEVMREKIAASWSQSKIEMRFRPDGTRLHILARNKKSTFDNISQRSDGLRQYVALVAFLSTISSDQRDIILLIDEIEIHLHYDAQADLVQMLAKQPLARKVVFTTHSIGCLPEDLGMGIRIIETQGDTSSIVNRFWAQEEIGFSPILFGMGAATMAFVPIRLCVLTEGASDMILLPSMLKAATGREFLGYQVSPALAEASAKHIKLLESQGSNVVFLVDGDTAGKEILKKLKSAGVKDARIVKLSEFIGQDCVIEDFLDKNIYVAAINDEISRRRNVAVLINNADITDTLRPTALENWCKEKNIKVPSKVDVAYRVLDRMSDGDAICKTRVESLRKLEAHISAIFNLAKPTS